MPDRALRALSQQSAAHSQPLPVPPPPPPLRAEVKPPKPHRKAVWIAGHWLWKGKAIGYVWVPIELASPGTPLTVESEHGTLTGETAAIPFVDPNKERPAQPLRGAAG